MRRRCTRRVSTRTRSFYPFFLPFYGLHLSAVKVACAAVACVTRSTLAHSGIPSIF